MKRLLLENLGLKITAVLIAIFLWLFVTASGQSEISFKAPIEFKNVPVGLGVIESSTQVVDVTVRGQERIMKYIRPGDIRVFVKLDKAKKGEGIYYINKENIELPYAVSIMNIQPSSLKLKLEETATRTVLVKPTITGIPKQGYFVKSIEIDPQKARIEGLQSKVRGVHELRTEAMDITGLSETATQLLNIDIAGAQIKTSISTVKVRVVITRGEG